MKSLRTAAFITLCVIPCFATQKESSVDTTQTRVLIAWEDTRFKKELVAQLRTILEKEKYQVSVVIHTNDGLASVKATDFDAVFITNSGVNSVVRAWVNEWIATWAAQASRIVLHTTQTRAWEVKTAAGVDAVTSASSIPDIPDLAAQFAARIIAIVNTASKGSDGE